MALTPRWRAPILASTLAAALVVTVALVATPAVAATLFSDDFEDGNSTGWSTSGGSWSVTSDGSRVFHQASTGADAKAQAGSTSWTDYTVQARVKPVAFGSSTRSTGIAARAQSMTNFYSLVLLGQGRVELRRTSGGGVTVLAGANLAVNTGSWYTLALSVSGSSLTGSVNGTALLGASDSTFATGRVGLVGSYTRASFDDVLAFTGGAPSPSASSSGPASPSPSVSPPASPSPSTSPGPIPPAGQPDGYASVNSMGINGTTGGAGGPTVTVTTASELANYAGQNTPYVILISGRISASGMITVVANKTILGLGTTAEIDGGGLQLGTTTRPGHNVIIRNITFRNAGDDSVSVHNGSHHVWIDHNDFYPGSDGSVDVKRQSSYVTISWNRFRGTDKSMLLGHSDSFPADIGFLKVTYHHNLFDGSRQRHPRVRFGEPVHVYNNYYRNVALYGVASTENAGVVVEGNYFENVPFPCHSVSGYADSAPGRLVQRNNAFVNSGVCEAGGTVAEPSGYYSYRLDPASSVPSSVLAGAGTGKI